MDSQPSIFPDKLRPTLAGEMENVAGNYSPRYPANPFDREQAKFVQAALHKLGYPKASIGESAAFWQNYICSWQTDWPDDVYTVAGAIECIRLYCRFVAGEPEDRGEGEDNQQQQDGRHAA